jgi:anti-anti-sigma factor
MIKSQEQINGVVVVRVTGEINNSTTPDLHKICDKVSSQNDVAGILLDLDEVTSIDTSAFACMINFLKEHSPEDIKVGIINLKQQDKALMDLLKISGIINVFKNKEEALRELPPGGKKNG